MTRLALRNPYLVLVGALALVVLGAFSPQRIPVDPLLIFKTSAVAAETAHSLATSRCAGGSGLLVEVLQADLSRIAAQAALAGARAELGRSELALTRAAGGAAATSS